MNAARPGVEVTSVEPAAGATRQLGEVVISRPRAGQGIAGHGLRISGQAMVSGSQPTTVTLLSSGIPVHEVSTRSGDTRLSHRFQGMVRKAPFPFELSLSTLGLPPSFDLEIRAARAGEAGVSLGRIRGSRPRLVSAYRPHLTPILLSSFGRSGSTYAMRLLGEHPAVAVHRRFPYEVRYAQYWMHTLLVVSAPADHLRPHRTANFQDRPLVGSNPFHHHDLMSEYTTGDEIGTWFEGEVDRLAVVVLQNIDGFYGRVAAADGLAGVTHFIEKLPAAGQLFWPFDDLYPGLGTVSLVRDPRDVLCSVLAFNRKRGTVRFGREAVASDAAFARALGDRLRETLAVADVAGIADGIVRYEDLVLTPHDVLPGLLERLGLDASPAIVDAMVTRASVDTASSRDHRTTEHAGASVGRWRRDLAGDMQATAESSFGDLILRLGYDV